MLRAELGEDAIIVATQELPEGGVRITGAIESEDVDLAELLAPTACPPRAPAPARGGRPSRAAEPLARRLLDAAATRAAARPRRCLAPGAQRGLPFRAGGGARRGRCCCDGPPGAGKTASVAKLAAAAVLEGRPVSVVTADTARAGGVEQLAALLAPLELRPSRRRSRRPAAPRGRAPGAPRC